MRCRAHWRVLGYLALVPPSLVIRDRCPKPNTCRATALSGVTQLAYATWFENAVNKHIAGECLDIFKVYIVRRKIMEEDRTCS